MGVPSTSSRCRRTRSSGPARGRRPSACRGTFDAVRGSITLYIAVTGVVFALLLAGHQEDLDTHIGWVNFVVHTLIPIVVVVDWLLEPANHRLPLRLAALWLAYPILWFAYTLARVQPRTGTRTRSSTWPPMATAT
jgi:hypothetical protein